MINILPYTSWLMFKDKTPQALMPCQEASDLLVVLLGNTQINCCTAATEMNPSMTSIIKFLFHALLLCFARLLSKISIIIRSSNDHIM